jgi:hypothetical protein
VPTLTLKILKALNKVSQNRKDYMASLKYRKWQLFLLLTISLIKEDTMATAKVISGEETGLVGEIVNIQDGVVTLSCTADNGNLYTYTQDQIQILDKVADEIEADIIKNLEIDELCRIYESELLRPEDL